MVKLIGLMLMTLSCLPQTSQAASDIEVAGDWVQILIPSIAYGTTLYLGDDEGETQMYKSFATNLATTYVLKIGVGRERPDKSNNHSFPSGHTSAAFQGAAFIHARYGLKYALPAYIGASFVGYSRVYANKHFTSDVIAGAALGTLSSFYFATPYQGATVKPTANNGAYGIEISASW